MRKGSANADITNEGAPATPGPLRLRRDSKPAPLLPLVVRAHPRLALVGAGRRLGNLPLAAVGRQFLLQVVDGVVQLRVLLSFKSNGLRRRNNHASSFAPAIESLSITGYPKSHIIRKVRWGVPVATRRPTIP